METPTFPGCVVDARPIGILDMSDEQGHDEKILCVPTKDPRYRHIVRLEDIGPHWLREIENFFSTYKALEDKWTELVGWKDEEEAWRVIAESEVRWQEYLEMKASRPKAPPEPPTRENFQVAKSDLAALESAPGDKNAAAES
jgi:inorganic pyrophosphatase